MDKDYNPHSLDSMVSTILTKVDEIRKTQEEEKAAREAHEKRISDLEKNQWYQRGVVAAIAVGASALWHMIKGDS